MRKTKWSFLLTLMLVLSVFVAACSGGGEATPEETPADEGTTTEGEATTPEEPASDVAQVLNVLETAEIPTMDTVMGTDAVAFEWGNAVFEGLYALGENAQPVPGVAESHEVSEDGKVYTFKLREDAVWSDGSQVVADDFIFTWQKVVNPETGSQYNFIMGDILNANSIMAGEMTPDQLGVKAIDETTLEVTLEQPVDYFLSLTAFPVYFPQKREFVEAQGENYALEVENLLFNGPFVMTEWKHEEGWVLKKNPNYWDKDVVKLEEINIKVVKDVATGVNLYDTGKVDRAGLTSEFVDKYRNDPAFTTIEETVVFWFKMNQENEALANENIRKAIALGVDRQGLTDVILNNGSIPAYTAVPKGFVSHPETGEEFNDKYGNFYEFDADLALEHWNKGLEELGLTELSLEILGGDTETAKKSDAYFKDQLEKHLPGLTVTLLEVPFKQRLELDETQQYDLQVAGWGPDYLDAMTFVDLWVTGGGHNMMSYSNPEFDQLIEDSKTNLTGVERFEAMQEAARIVMEDAAFSPLYQRARAVLIQPYIKDMFVLPFGPDYTYKWASIEK
ncbi:peptide ABC transporter substrate-binding protein [Chengkuizengella axinellae]|uniref:Peptide ABC transporter substrate-binding protein n=1 Tax=Chengkuizengella axinellae TaxID=3064388 RepID=A0ABT9IVE8_9BACL|nr:peptide ABC transporter substrate-binding protein [Chengkuizengella sp. 2205SS18-9]MDP5273341.1 peptide ABC transporter substrate-binding protein [Chengkuizengella sp. 2205SS18-9]